MSPLTLEDPFVALVAPPLGSSLVPHLKDPLFHRLGLARTLIILGLAAYNSLDRWEALYTVLTAECFV